jgi:hypothetical protein
VDNKAAPILAPSERCGPKLCFRSRRIGGSCSCGRQMDVAHLALDRADVTPKCAACCPHCSPETSTEAKRGSREAL